MIRFGVGCFHFALSDNFPKEVITTAEYMETVVKTLEKVTSINNINISCGDRFKDDLILSTPPNSKMQNGEYCFPHIYFFRLTFNVYIPFRIQAKLINENEDNIHTGTENFTVFMRHDWHGPVSFVQCVNPKAKCSPSDAVRVVREFLENEFSNEDDLIVMDYLGPSPFHADFSLSINSNETELTQPIELDHIKKVGYDALNFKAKKSLFSNEEEAFKKLMSNLEGELGFFYLLIQLQAKRIHAWHDIKSQLNEIIECEENKKNFLKRIFIKPYLIKNLYRNLMFFKAEDIFDVQRERDSYATIYTSGKSIPFFKSFIDNELETKQEYPINETKDLLGYIDQKTSKGWELVVVFMAGILASSFGSILTKILSSPPDPYKTYLYTPWS
jgi:hypothetical protein